MENVNFVENMDLWKISICVKCEFVEIMRFVENVNFLENVRFVENMNFVENVNFVENSY